MRRSPFCHRRFKEIDLMTPVEACQKNLAALETKLADAHAWQAKVAGDIKTLAFDAHVQGGEPARRLEELQDLARLGEQNTASLEAAIAEARKRLAAAQAGEADEAEKAKATRALALLSAFETRGEALAARLTEVL
jgi:hypothetical protein